LTLGSNLLNLVETLGVLLAPGTRAAQNIRLASCCLMKGAQILIFEPLKGELSNSGWRSIKICGGSIWGCAIYRHFVTSQFFGEFDMIGPSDINWSSFYTDAVRDDPGLPRPCCLIF
jgi:hypothetical protein